MEHLWCKTNSLSQSLAVALPDVKGIQSFCRPWYTRRPDWQLIAWGCLVHPIHKCYLTRWGWFFCRLGTFMDIHTKPPLSQLQPNIHAYRIIILFALWMPTKHKMSKANGKLYYYTCCDLLTGDRQWSIAEPRLRPAFHSTSSHFFLVHTCAHVCLFCLSLLESDWAPDKHL